MPEAASKCPFLNPENPKFPKNFSTLTLNHHLTLIITQYESF